MKNNWKVLFIFGLQLLVSTNKAQALAINGLHYQTTAQQMRLAFDVTASPKHRVFVLTKPARLVVDIQNAQLQQKLAQPSASHPLFARLRYAVKDNSDLRVVIDLKKPIDANHFSLNSNNKDETKLLVDLIPKNAPVEIQQEANPQSNSITTHDTAFIPVTAETKATTKTTTAQLYPTRTHQDTNKKDKIVIALDAGHGGDDPGAKGNHGTYEKDVVFSIAQKLQKLINAHSGMKAIMVRKGDYFINLRERMQIARSAKADLFISIHADAFHNNTAHGASVYTLSNNGASSEAAYWLAQNENQADLVGGVSLSDKEEVLASVLFDLSQTATQEASANVADSVLKNLQMVSDLHRDSVQKAGFMVLKSPDIPSILVETAFISNTSEEQKLLEPTHQARLAQAIYDGICDYFHQPKTPALDSKVAAL